MTTGLPDGHVPEPRLLDAVCGDVKLTAREQNHVDSCEECRELVGLFKRLGMTKNADEVKRKTAS